MRTNKQAGESVTDKIIVILGDFPTDKNNLIEFLKHINFKFSDEVTASSWLWVGENPDLSQIKKAQNNGAKISTLKKLVDIFYTANLVI